MTLSAKFHLVAELIANDFPTDRQTGMVSFNECMRLDSNQPSARDWLTVSSPIPSDGQCRTRSLTHRLRLGLSPGARRQCELSQRAVQAYSSSRQ
jgi:hypothetical protein